MVKTSRIFNSHHNKKNKENSSVATFSSVELQFLIAVINVVLFIAEIIYTFC